MKIMLKSLAVAIVLYAVVVLVAVIAVKSQRGKSDTAKGTSAAPEPAYVSDLRNAAAKKNLKWRVICDEDPDDPPFFAIATYPNDTEIGTYEDGALDFWGERGETQEEAAERLALAVGGDPNVHRSHKKSAQRRKQCMPEISGGPK